MAINKKRSKKIEKSSYNITAKGSLGILAFGDIGLRAWRKAKQESNKKDSK